MSFDRKTKVLIVDDSRTVCRYLESVFSEDPDMTVVGFALGAEEAQNKLKTLSPDVITLDVEMPGMNGLTFLKNLMRTNPIPVVMFSSLTEVGATATLDALEAGAVDFMPKRSNADGVDLDDYVRELRGRVKIAAKVRVKPPQAIRKPVVASTLPDLKQCRVKLRRGLALGGGLHKVVAIGASTGGPEALRHVMQELSVNKTALILSQHMPPKFVGSFAQRMDKASVFDVQMAVDGEKIVVGRGYLAPGDQHLEIVRKGADLYCVLSSTPKVSGHRPSVNVLFESLAKNAAEATVAVLLTGMGDDGANGMAALRTNGAVTFAQNEESSVVWGMPGSAVALDAADAVLDLSEVGTTLNSLLR